MQQMDELYCIFRLRVLLHEAFVKLLDALNEFLYLRCQERSAEMQGALLLAESIARYDTDTSLLQ